jgi:arylsulfatase A-like enzyme/Tfp pilus assembly protein PilF
MLPALVLAAAAASTPNVVLVTIDTLRADYLGAYGNKKVETATTDRIAREGVVADDATSHVPQTRPSHGSILTGLYPWSHGLRDNYSPKMDQKIPTLATLLKARGYATGAFVSGYVLNAGSGLDVGFDTYDDPFGAAANRPGRGSHRFDRPANEALDKALAWLKPRDKKPFFLWLHLYDPHIPYDPPAPYNKKFEDNPYAGEVSFADAQLGRLLKHLDDARLRERTLVVVTSDHGEGLGEHGEEEHLLFLYETTQKVPLLFSWPGTLPQGTRVAGQFRHVDLAPTILELIGAPALPSPAGRSRAANLRSTARIPDNESPSEAIYGSLHFGYAPVRALRAEGWKYVDAPRAELYNLRDDPRELKNVIEMRGQVAEAMRARLLTYDPGAKEKPKVETKVDADTAQRLAALGYVGGAVPLGGAASGADPKDKVAEYQAYRRMVVQANAAFVRGDLDGALAVVRRIARTGMGAFDLRLMIGRIWLRKGDIPRAVESLEAVIKSAPHAADAYIELARAHAQGGQFDKALEALDRGTKQDAAHKGLQAERGFVLRQKGDLAAARAALERAKARDPENDRVREGLALVYRDMGDLRKAVSEMQAAVKADPQYGDGWRTLGDLLSAQKKWPEAARAYERAIRVNARDGAAMFALGKAYLQSDPPRALSAFQRLVGVDPGYPGVSDALREARAVVPVVVRIIRVADRAAADEIAAQLAAGGNFAEIARARSTDPSAANGGALGAVRPSALEPALRDVVVALPPGQVSAVIEAGNGFAIVRREEGN